MNRSWLFLFLFILSVVACDNGFDNGTKHPVKQTHDYYQTDEENQNQDGNSLNTHNQNSSEEDEFLNLNGSSLDLYGSADRRFWQKPDLIIRRLGKLDGKVLADIGAGPYGYFTFRIISKTGVERVIATDIDQGAVSYIDSLKTLMLPMDLQRKVETRIVVPNDPKLKEAEADIVFLVNTYLYIEEGIPYLRKLKKGLKKGGKLFLVDFKKRRLPIGPPPEEKVALYELENELSTAGFSNIISDDQSLEYQYIIEASNL